MAQINNYFNYLKGYHESFPWNKGEIKVSEYRSKKTVKAVQYFDNYNSIKAIKELAGNKVKVEDFKLSLYNSEFEVYIEVNEGDWIVKDDENLFVMTDSEFRSAYESEIEIENKFTNDKLMEYFTRLTRQQQINPYENTLTIDHTYYDPSTTYTLNDNYISNSMNSIPYPKIDPDGSISGTLANSVSTSYVDAKSSISNRLDDLEATVYQTKDRMDKFIEDYVTPNGN